MAKSRRKHTARLKVERLESRVVPTTAPWMLETFEQSAIGVLPSGWGQHSSDPSATIQTTTTQAQASTAGLQSSGTSSATSLAWLNNSVPADAQVSASVYLDTLIPAQIIARGQNLDTDTPSYYAVSVTRGVQLQLLRVVNGQSTVLQTLQSGSWRSGQWVRVSLTTVGNALKVQVFRTDTAQYLAADGTWQMPPTEAIVANDTAITSGGSAGLGRSAQ